MTNRSKKLFLISIELILLLLLSACNSTLFTGTPASENIATITVTVGSSSPPINLSPTAATPLATDTLQATPLPALSPAKPTVANSATVNSVVPSATFTIVIAPTPTSQAIRISNPATPSPPLPNTATAQPTTTALVRTVSVSATSPDSQEQAFLQLLNAYRQANGQPPLVFEPTLFKSARWLAQDMASKNYIGHTDSAGRNIIARLRAFGYSGNVPGENIAGGLEMASENLKIWQSDDIHKNNLLGAYYTKAGIGRYYDPNSGNRWYWVLDLG